MKFYFRKKLNTSEELANILRIIHCDSKITQTDLAAKMVTSQSKLAKKEKGKIVPVKTFIDFAQKCGKNIPFEVE